MPHTCPHCGEPVTPGPRGMVFGYMYDVESNRNWIAGSDRGAYFHEDCWAQVKERAGASQPTEAE